MDTQNATDNHAHHSNAMAQDWRTPGGFGCGRSGDGRAGERAEDVSCGDVRGFQLNENPV